MTAKKENVKTTSNMTYHSILAPNVTTSVYTTISATTPLLSGGYGGKPSVTGNNGAVMSVPHGENTVRIEKTATLDIQDTKLVLLKFVLRPLHLELHRSNGT